MRAESRPELLVLAYECSPTRGSEAGAGFSLLQAMSNVARCTVIVGEADAPALEAWAREHPDCGLSIVAVPESRFGRRLYHLHHYTQFVSYLLWLDAARAELRALAGTGRFVAAWHLTYSPFWLPTPLRDVSDITTIWGPVAGAERSPRGALQALPWRSRLRERIDMVSTNIASHLPPVRRSYANVDLLITSLNEHDPSPSRRAPTRRFVQSSLVKVPQWEPVGELDDVLYYTSPMRLQKGPLIAVEAAARNPRVRLTIAPARVGYLRRDVERIIRKYGAEDRVVIADGLTRDELLERLRRSKGYVHPAVVEVASMAFAEALALGVPVVALDVPGARSLQTYTTQPDFVHLVPVDDPDRVVDEFGTAMAALLDATDRPDGPLLDQRELAARLGGYLDEAVAFHERRRSSVPATDRPLRLLQLLYTVQDRGGEAVAHGLARGFREHGHTTVNVGVYRSAPGTSMTADFDILFPRRPTLLGNVQCFLRLVRRMRKERPDAVLLHGDLAQIIGGPAAVVAGVRRRVAINHLALGVSVRWLRYVHVLLGMLGVYSEVVFVGQSSRQDADGLPKRFLARCHVIPNAVRVPVGDRTAVRARLGIPDEVFVFLNVGSLTEQKNQGVLLDAVAHLPDAMLVIVGDGPRQAEFDNASKRLDGRVRLVGRVPLEDMGGIYAMADAFVFPSLFEGRPLALLEAARAGLPIIASPIAENIEVTGDAADYVGVDDVAGWSAAMRRMRNDAAHRDARREAIAGIDVGSDEAMIRSYLRLLG